MKKIIKIIIAVFMITTFSNYLQAQFMPHPTGFQTLEWLIDYKISRIEIENEKEVERQAMLRLEHVLKENNPELKDFVISVPSNWSNQRYNNRQIYQLLEYVFSIPFYNKKDKIYAQKFMADNKVDYVFLSYNTDHILKEVIGSKIEKIEIVREIERDSDYVSINLSGDRCRYTIKILGETKVVDFDSYPYKQ